MMFLFVVVVSVSLGLTKHFIIGKFHFCGTSAKLEKTLSGN